MMKENVLTKDEIKPNKIQQECIDNIEGQYLVLAGPGTGKTFTVSRRIENMINKGIKPDKILCLTFSETAALEMKNKIDNRLNKIESGVNVYTYHGFCNEIISNNLDIFELSENYKVISSTVERKFIKECIDEIQPVAFRTELNDPYRFIDDILNGIKAIKQNRLKKDQYFSNLKNNIEWYPALTELEEKKEIATKKNKTTKTLDGEIKKQKAKIAQAEELWKFFELYSLKMRKYHYIDYNDMIGLVLDKFETDESFLSQIANEYDYLLVDEYQDTNKSQNEIVFNLSHAMKQDNVFVVGDDDQIVYSFQGARLDTMERFLREFPKTKVICLKENMRSTQNILDAAYKIAKQDIKRLEANPEFSKKYNISKELIAKNEEIAKFNKPVRFYKYADIIQEQTKIVDEIEQLINSPDCPRDKEGNKNLNEIAILTRSNLELDCYADILKARNIPYELKEGKDIFKIKSSIILYYYLQMLSNPELHSDKIFRILLNPPFKINLEDYRLLYEIKSQHKAFLNSIRELNPSVCKDYEKLKKIVETYDDLKAFSANENLLDVVLQTGAKTGIFNYFLNSDINRCENIAGLKKLIDSARELSQINKTVTLEDFVEYLDTCLNDDIILKTDKAPVDMNAVQLTTYHSSKGKEYAYVYMPSMFNTKWETKRTQKAIVPLEPSEGKTKEEYDEQKESDNIKTMYVGLTRAKHALRLSYYSLTGSRTHLTKYIDSIQDIFQKEEIPFEYSENSYWDEIKKTLIKKDYDYKKDFCSIVDMKLKNRTFSPTYLNEYRKCPRSFLYNRILEFNSPAEIADAMNFGSAIHETLFKSFEYAKENNQYPVLDWFLDEFIKQLKKQNFSSYEQREIMKVRGLNALKKYYHHFCDTPINSFEKAESSLKYEIGGYLFTGKIDRIEKNSDGTYSIMDYKTGSAKGKNEIGIGKNHEDYYFQIGFYKYLFEKMTNLEVSKTMFIYPEYPESSYEIEFSDDEIEKIKDEYIKTIEDIKAYRFEPEHKKDINQPPCKYCSFNKFCELDVM